MTSTLLEMLSGGGIRIWTLVLRGGLNRFVHFLISGIWLCKIRLVAGVAVAVIMRKDPDSPESSPLIMDIAGLNAFLESLARPQLATERIMNFEYRLQFLLAANQYFHIFKTQNKVFYHASFCQFQVKIKYSES